MGWFLLLTLLAWAQLPPPGANPIRLYLGPIPETEAEPSPVPGAFKDSYADLRRVHGKRTKLYRNTPSSPPLVLVEGLAQADLVLTVIHRGRLARGASVPGSPPGTTNDSDGVPALVARLTVRGAGDTVDLSGIVPGRTRRVRWTDQAERIYTLTIAFADTHHAALVRLRAVR